LAFFGLLLGDLQMVKDEFLGAVVGVTGRDENTSIGEKLIEIVYIHCHDLSRLLDEQDILLK